MPTVTGYVKPDNTGYGKPDQTAATSPPGGANIGAETLESSDGSGEPGKRPDWLAELSRKQANRRYRFITILC